MIRRFYDTVERERRLMLAEMSQVRVGIATVTAAGGQ